MTSSGEIPPLHYLRFWTTQMYISSASNNLTGSQVSAFSQDYSD